jgi:hypothetical protein
MSARVALHGEFVHGACDRLFDVPHSWRRFCEPHRQYTTNRTRQYKFVTATAPKSATFACTGLTFFIRPTAILDPIVGRSERCLASFPPILPRFSLTASLLSLLVSLSSLSKSANVNEHGTFVSAKSLPFSCLQKIGFWTIWILADLSSLSPSVF